MRLRKSALNAVLMAKNGVDPAVIAKVTGYPQMTIERWVCLYDKYGTTALNYWVTS
jgi:hypothetical protein